MDSRRLLLMLIFSFSAVMLWDAWQRHNNPQLYATANKVAEANQAGSAAPTPSASLQTPGGTTPTVQAPASASVVTITTDNYKAEVSTLGGDLVHLELLEHKSNDHQSNLMLFDRKYQYAAQSGLIGEGLPTHKTLFKAVSAERVLADGAKEIKLRLEAEGVNGLKVVKVLTFSRDSYVINVAWELENNGQKALAPHAYFQLQRTNEAPQSEVPMDSSFTGPAFFTDAEKYQKIDFADIPKDKAKHAKTADNGWVAMVQHYFVSAWAPKGNAPREFYVRKVNPDGSLVAAGLILPIPEIAVGAKATLEVPLFAGPQEQILLKQFAPGLELVVDYGWLTVIAAPIFWVLQWIYKMVGNWGWAIVVLTIGLKAIFYPLSAASYRSMAKMRLVTPRLMQLKERFGDDKQRLNQEMMKLYQTEKINPLGGCLPILVQIPVFIALYWVLLGAVEMRGAPWVGWITDLSTADPYYVLPVVMMVTMLIQTKLNPTPPDPIQAKVMMAMPFIFGVMFFFFPAGLVLYWVVNNILSIAQQWQITRSIEGAGKS